MKHFYILSTLLLTVYGQVVIKLQVMEAGSFPAAWAERATWLLRLLVSPWILSVVAAVFLAGLCWMVAMEHFELSYAYPFMALAFPMVLLCSAFLIGEPLTMPRVAGTALIVLGLIVLTR